MEGGDHFVHLFPGPEDNHPADKLPAVPDVQEVRILHPSPHQSGVRVRQDRPIPINSGDERNLPPVLLVYQLLKCWALPRAPTARLGRQLQADARPLVPQRLLRHADGGAVVQPCHRDEAER
jgi:hypothetical protein